VPVDCSGNGRCAPSHPFVTSRSISSTVVTAAITLVVWYLQVSHIGRSVSPDIPHWSFGISRYPTLVVRYLPISHIGRSVSPDIPHWS
jgi:hypothetical protein